MYFYIQCCVEWKVDTGADVMLSSIGNILKSDRKLYGASAQKPVSLIGMVKSRMAMGEKRITETVFLIKRLTKPLLLGMPAIKKLRLLKDVDVSSTVTKTSQGVNTSQPSTSRIPSYKN